MTGWRHERVEVSIAQIAPQGSAVCLEHGQLDPRALVAESPKHVRDRTPSRSTRDAQSQAADLPCFEIAPGRSGRVRRGEGGMRPAEEELSGLGQICASGMAHE